MSEPIVVAPDQAPAPFHIVGEEITVLAAGSRTGSFEFFRQRGPAGTGPPPHSHPWEEAFYVVGGEVAFGVDDQQDLVAGSGTLVVVPRGSTHWFRFGPSGGEMISVTSHAGASGFFAQVDREVSPTEPDIAALIGIGAAHGLDFPAPPA